MAAQRGTARIEPAACDATRLADADDIGRELVRLVRLIERTGAHYASVRNDSIERAAYVLLARLTCDGPQRSSALAEAVHSDPSTVSRQVAGLVRMGLVERRPDPEDGRACLLAASAEGERIFHRNRRMRNEHVATMLADWTSADRQAFVGLLDRFNTDFENYRPQPIMAAAQDVVPAEQGGPTS